MPGNNDFLPIATGGGAFVETQATFAADSAVLANGFPAGILTKEKLNKVVRQSSIMSSVVAQFLNQQTGQNIVDDGTTATLLAQLGEVFQDGAYSTAVAGGTADALTAIFNPAITSLDNQTVYIKAASANATTAPTLNPGSGIIPIVKGNNLPLAINDIPGAGYWMEINLDATLGKAVLLNPAMGVFSNLPLGYKNGINLANNGASSIDFSAGIRRSSANSFDMLLSSTMTKLLQSSGAWTSGSGNNGLFSGAKANSTWYHCFIIRKTSDGSIDAGFDTSITAANIPSGYVGYRRVGSIKTDSSGNIMPFDQFGDNFLFKAPPLDMSAVALPTTATNYAISTPPGIKCLAKLFPLISGNESSIYMRDPDATALAAPGFAGTANFVTAGASTAETMGAEIRIMTNVSSQISIISNNSPTMYLLTHGWADYNL